MLSGRTKRQHFGGRGNIARQYIFLTKDILQRITFIVFLFN